MRRNISYMFKQIHAKEKTERLMIFHIEYTRRMQVVLTKIYSHNFLNNTGTIMHII